MADKLQNSSQLSSPPGIHTLCNHLPFSVNMTCDLLLNNKRWQRLSLPWFKWYNSDFCLASSLLLLSFCLTHFNEVTSHFFSKDHGSRSFFSQAINETPTLADRLISNSGETWKQRTQAICAQIPDPQKLWDNKCVLF